MAPPGATATTTPTTTTSTAPPSVDAATLGARITAAMKAAKTGKATTSSSVSGQTIEIVQRFVFTGASQPDSVSTMSIAGMTLDIVTHDGVAYMKGFPAQMTGGKVWAKLDPNGSDQLSKALKEQIGAGPQDLVGVFKGGSVTVLDHSGGDTRYRVSGIAVGGQSDVTMEVTVDGKDLPVRSVVTAGGQQATVTYSDWGVPVTVTVPPADQVGTLKVPTS